MEYEINLENLKQRQQRITNLIIAIEHRLPALPEGKLRIHHYKTSTSYYMVEEGKNDCGTLLKKDDKTLYTGLAQKSYYQKVLKAAKEELKLIDQFLRRFPKPAIEQVYESLPKPRQKLITPIILPDDQYIKQ